MTDMHKIEIALNQIEKGDIVKWKAVNVDAHGLPAWNDCVDEYESEVVELNGQLVLKDTHIKIDRLVSASFDRSDIVQGAIFIVQGAVFIKAWRNVRDSVDEYWGNLAKHKRESRANKCTFYVSERHRTWYVTADGRWCCIAAASGPTMSNTIQKHLAFLDHEPKGEGKMTRIGIDFDEYL